MLRGMTVGLIGFAGGDDSIRVDGFLPLLGMGGMEFLCSSGLDQFILIGQSDSIWQG